MVQEEEIIDTANYKKKQISVEIDERALVEENDASVESYSLYTSLEPD